MRPAGGVVLVRRARGVLLHKVRILGDVLWRAAGVGTQQTLGIGAQRATPSRECIVRERGRMSPTGKGGGGDRGKCHHHAGGTD